eukprot:CAMPEP_0116875986 /NCGR_PEP_ID=MMETSP0463-20121206/8063_1 /TAXON_ID=181622 /ORGANISM="Strombidinopsis sp, Strain SopsisLIS2011" /LENGTH=164 /DNA_ID=CAMNT_0004522409 /DNA_START=340 /DNA_END=834 /DNA_ORIENTATION=+
MITPTTSCLTAVPASMVSATIATGGVTLMIQLGLMTTQRLSTANHLSGMIGPGVSALATAHIPTTQKSITTTVIAAGAVIWKTIPTVATTAGTVSKERKISTLSKTLILPTVTTPILIVGDPTIMVIIAMRMNLQLITTSLNAQIVNASLIPILITITIHMSIT